MLRHGRATTPSPVGTDLTNPDACLSLDDVVCAHRSVCVCLRRRPADVYGPRAHATVGHVHPSPGRSCWFLVGQVARGRQIAGQVAVLFSRGAHVVTQGDACGDPTATHWFYGLIAVFYQKQVLRR